MSWHDRIVDLRIAKRSIERRPGFALAAVATLGLAVGAMASMVSIVSSVLSRPLPVTDPDQLVSICEVHPSVAGFCVASPPDAMDWAQQTPGLASLGLARDWPFTRRVDGRNRGVRGGLATAGWFETLGISMAEGRAFAPSDVGASAARVAIVTHEFAATALSDRPSAVGATLVLDDSTYTVIGVLPAGLSVPLLDETQVWVPFPFDPRDESRRDWRGFLAVGRLVPGVDRTAALSQLRTVAERLALSHTETNRGWGVSLRSLHEAVVGSARPALLAFLGATALAVLIAVVNLSVLLLVRWWERAREIAVREALGGSAGRIALLLLTEAALLASGGAAVGALLAPWLTRTFVRFAPASIPRLAQVSVQPSVLAWALVGAVGLTLAIALAPTLRSARRNLSEGLRATGRLLGPGGRPVLQRALVVAELALATTLLVGAALLGRSFVSYLRWDPGFDHDHVAVMWTLLPSSRASGGAVIRATFDRLREEAAAVPGIRQVSQASSGPLFGGTEASDFQPAGTGDDARFAATWHDVGPGYFGTIGLPLVRGRDVSEADLPGAPRVAIVNETFARRAWPGQNPIGKTARWMVGDNPTFEVVGVAADVAPWRAGTVPEPEIYWPFAQNLRLGTFIVVRTTGDPALVSRTLEQRLAAASPDAQIGTVRTLNQAAERLLVSPRFTLLLVAGYGLLTLLVAGVGLYGVIAFLVARRRRDIAIRIALGAPRERITGSVLLEGLGLGVAGIALGAVGALAIRRFLAPLLAGVRSTDPASYAAVALGLLVISLVAAHRPARQAARTDPARILRSE